MASPIRISTQEVRTTAQSIRSQNTVLNQELREIQTHMNNLSATWQSPAGEAIRAKFNATANKFFDDYYAVVNSYAQFLDVAVAESYEHTEATLTSNADAFKV